MDDHFKHVLSSKSPVTGVAVLGAINIDIICQSEELPQAKGVVYGKGLSLTLGGKGTNVAVALTRLGIPVYSLGTVGDDTLGHEAMAIMEKNRIITKFVQKKPGESTGTAIIFVNQHGDSAMVVNKDANDKIDNQAIHDFFANIDSGKVFIKVLYVTLELPMEIAIYAITEANRRNIPVFCQAEPLQQDVIPERYYPKLEFFSINRKGAEKLTGIPIQDFAGAEAAAQALRAKGATNIIITLGEDGALVLARDETHVAYYPASKIEVKDTTAAGDAFRAAFISSYSRYNDLHKAMTFAIIAGEYTASTHGTYTSMPRLRDLKFSALVYKKLGIKNIIFDYNGVLSFDFPLQYKNVMNLFRKYGKEELTFETFRREFFYPLPDFYKKYIPEVPFEELDRIYFENYTNEGDPSIYARVKRTLEQLTEKNVNLIIFSSHKKDKIEQELQGYGISSKLFKNIYGGIKDKVAFIQQVVSENSFMPSETAYVGDTEHDIQTAKAAGVTSIASTYGYLSKERLALAIPDIYIRSIEELVELV